MGGLEAAAPPTRPRAIIRAMLAALLTSLLLCQDPAPGGQNQAPAVPVSAAPKAPEPVPAIDDRAAKAVLDEFTKVMKTATSMAERGRAVDALGKGANKQLVKPLAALVETEKSVIVRKRAAELLGLQPAADANPALRKLLKSPKVTSPAVQQAIVKALMFCGYQSAQWADLADLFEKDYAAECVPLQETLLHLIDLHKEKQAIPLLLRNLDEPAPTDVHAGNNPPAAYWEARWKAWKAWREQVKAVLFTLTGQRFSSAKEAKEWLDKNPGK